MSYFPSTEGIDPKVLRELERIASALQEIPNIRLPVYKVLPKKPREGQVVIADWSGFEDLPGLPGGGGGGGGDTIYIFISDPLDGGSVTDLPADAPMLDGGQIP